MKRKNENKIVIRPEKKQAIFFILCGIFWCTLDKKFEYPFLDLLMAVELLLTSFMFYSSEITLSLEHINDGILIITNSLGHDYSLNANHLYYSTFSNLLSLEDNENIVYLEKCSKLIRELKKLGALKKELE